MAQKRIDEIAKERGLSSDDVVAKLRAAGVDVSGAAVEERDAARAFGNGNGGSRPAPEGRRQPVRAAGSTPPEGRRQPVRPGGAPPEGRRQPVRPGQTSQPPAGRRQPVRPGSAQGGGGQPPAGRGQPVRGGRTEGSEGPPRPAPRRPVLDDLPVDPRRQMGRGGSGQASRQASQPVRERPPVSAEAEAPEAPEAAAPAAAQPVPVEQPIARQPEPAPVEQPAAPAPEAAPEAPEAPEARQPAPPAEAPRQPAAPAGGRSEGGQRPSRGTPAREGGRGPQGRQGGRRADRPSEPPRPQVQVRRPAPTGPVDPRVQQANRGRPGTPPPVKIPRPEDTPAPAAAEASAAPAATGGGAESPAKPEEAKPVVGLTPARGAGPKIISVPEPPKRPKRDETQSQPGGGRPTRGGQRGEGGPGAGKRRVVIDSQAARRGPGQGGPGPGGGPPIRPPRRRRRRRRTFMEETAAPLDANALTRTDVVRVNSGSTVKDLAEYLGVPVPEIIKTLMGMGEMATLTQTLGDEQVLVVSEALGKEVEIVSLSDAENEDVIYDDDDDDLVERPPVITIMGHVDHGKTSLLDAIRSADVAAGEAGGITQHIGAYQVEHNDQLITFLDTPGHEAFTAMRARGARVTDIAVIVVAADDGMRPQTAEAIDHARAAEVPIVVAVNKIDKEGADPTRVRTELTQRGLQPSEWGGDTEYVDVSAKTHEGIDALLDTLLVVAELEELNANPDAEASGVVIESKLDPGRGPVVTVLIQRGTLRVGESLVAGSEPGRVRAMIDFRGERVAEALPGDPVEILGFDGVPDAGEFVRVVANDREARRLAQERETREKSEALARRSGRKMSFEDVFRRAKEDEAAELPLVVKGDVAGSVEALEDEIARLPQDEVLVDVIGRGVGGITESDVMLAAASDAIILGFNVRPVGAARELADREGVTIRHYSVIYKALDDLRAVMQGLLAPEEVEETVGTVEVRQTFRASRIGTIAGSYVTDGVVRRNAKVRVVRDGTVIGEATIGSLRRINDDVREVATGFECGIVLAGFADVQEGDVLEVYETRQVERQLQPS